MDVYFIELLMFRLVEMGFTDGREKNLLIVMDYVKRRFRYEENEERD